MQRLGLHNYGSFLTRGITKKILLKEKLCTSHSSKQEIYMAFKQTRHVAG